MIKIQKSIKIQTVNHSSNFIAINIKSHKEIKIDKTHNNKKKKIKG